MRRRDIGDIDMGASRRSVVMARVGDIDMTPTTALSRNDDGAIGGRAPVW
jgi:hypothetical protein